LLKQFEQANNLLQVLLGDVACDHPGLFCNLCLPNGFSRVSSGQHEFSWFDVLRIHASTSHCRQMTAEAEDQHSRCLIIIDLDYSWH
jgi:hypothetical protein